MTRSAAEHREEARRLRALAEIVTTSALRQTLLEAAATYDKLARSAAAGGAPVSLSRFTGGVGREG